MNELIKYDISYIKYDQTNNKDLYVNLLKIYLESHRDNSEIINNVINEIISPQKVEEGKYKIPIKFLFEEIRFEIPEILTTLNRYLYMDGKIPQKTGKIIEELYNNPNTYLYEHCIFTRNDKELANKICKEGLFCPNDRHNNLSETTFSTLQVKFIKFTRYLLYNTGIVILAAIPKEYIDNNGPVWGSDYDCLPELMPAKKMFILPEYIIGYCYDFDFSKNPYDLSERQQYMYHYADQGLKPIRTNNQEITTTNKR